MKNLPMIACIYSFMIFAGFLGFHAEEVRTVLLPYKGVLDWAIPTIGVVWALFLAASVFASQAQKA